MALASRSSSSSSSAFHATLLLALLLLLSLTGLLQAIPDEYDGFLHYREVDATQDQVLLDGSELSLSPEVWTAVCEEIPECSGFNSAGYLKAFPRNESVDSYISKTSCGVHGQANITEGSCLHKGRHWQFVHCSDARGGLDTWYRAKAQYNLPPNLMAEACRVDAACTGFVVTQDRQYGMLLEHWRTKEVTDVWTKIPKPRRNDTAVLSVTRARGPYRLRLADT